MLFLLAQKYELFLNIPKKNLTFAMKFKKNNHSTRIKTNIYTNLLMPFPAHTFVKIFHILYTHFLHQKISSCVIIFLKNWR